MANAYQEILKDPRWQKKRLEILNRDKFTCQSCGDDKQTLHVHHVIPNYTKPWETKSRRLITLCEQCHDIWHKLERIGYDFCHVAMVTKLYDEIEISDVNACCIERGEDPYLRDAKFIYRDE